MSNVNNTPKKMLFCSICQTQKIDEKFYMSNDLTLHTTGKYPYCKECLQNKCLDSSGKFNVDLFKQMLKIIDRPYLHDVYEKISQNYPDKIVGMYLKNIGMKHHKNKKWKHSTTETSEHKNNSENKEDYSFISDATINLFGAGYSDEEYKAMQRKYNFLKNNYPETTNMHIEALVTYVRYKIKEEFAVASGDAANSKMWSELSNKAATNAKINPSQLSKADLMGGLNTFSELSQAIEEAIDIVPILPKFKSRPNDALDFNIWCYINYARDLQGLPLCNYEDVYDFYDRRKEDYIKQYGDPYGIFEEDPSESNRKNIKKFITPLIEESDEEIEEEVVEDGNL